MKKICMRGWLLNKGEKRKTTVRLLVSCSAFSRDVLTIMEQIKPSTIYRTSLKGKSVLCWYTEVVSCADSIEDSVQELAKRIEPRKEDIIKICNESNTDVSLSISVKAEYTERPEMSIGPSVITFLKRINARLTLNYNYWW